MELSSQNLTSQSAGELGQVRDVVPRLLGLMCAAAFWLIIAGVVVGALMYLRLKLQLGRSVVLVNFVGFTAGIVILMSIVRLPVLVGGLKKMLMRFGHRPMQVLCVVMIVRCAWILLVPTQPFSDGETYVALAERLLADGSYSDGRSLAYKPPGFPIALASVFIIFGKSLVVAKLVGALLATLTEYFVWLWTRRQFGSSAAACALMLLVLWPGRTLRLDIISYDDWVLVLLMSSLLLMPMSRNRAATKRWSSSTALLRTLGAGVFLGAAIMTRPQFLLIVPLVPLWMMLCGWRLKSTIAHVAVLITAVVCVMLPWAMRNHRVFGQFVPLTTNAGFNMYGSFHPQGTGAFYGPAIEDIAARVGTGDYDELAYNSAGIALTRELFMEQPLFVLRRILLDKPAHYLGSDNVLAWYEAYLALWPNHPRLVQVLKAVLLVLCNSFYMAVMLAPLAFRSKLTSFFCCQPAAVFLLGVFVTGLVVHSLFEAQARYHIVYLPFWVMLLAGLYQTLVDRPSATEQNF